MRSRHGELSLRVDAFTVLAKALRPPPGQASRPDRRRDALPPARARPDRQRGRARSCSSTARGSSRRCARYLDGEGFIEVETPVLQPLYGGALARPFMTHHNALDRDLYLRIATELYLKRLIVGGLERVYELGKDFRNEGVSHQAQPRVHDGRVVRGLRRLRRRGARAWKQLVARGRAAPSATPASRLLARRGGASRFARRSREATGDRRARARATPTQLAARDRAQRGLEHARPAGARWAAAGRRPAVEVRRADAACSRRSCSTTRSSSRRSRASTAPSAGLVERWEAFAGGIEIANAFSELNDPDEQRARFERPARAGAARRRARRSRYDEPFVEALEQGMPPTGGVGLGIDRLVMLLTGRRLDPRGRAVPRDARLRPVRGATAAAVRRQRRSTAHDARPRGRGAFSRSKPRSSSPARCR